MQLRRAFVLVIGFCLSSALTKSTTEESEATEAILKKEIDRFEAVKKSFEDANMFVQVVYTHPFNKADGAPLKLDTFEIRTTSFENNPEGPQLEEKFDEDKVKSVFALAKKLNLTAVGSRQIFDLEGVLQEKTLLAEDLRIQFKDGSTHMVFEDHSDPDDELHSDDIQDYIGFMKKFELPVDVEITAFRRSGVPLLNHKDSYAPEKVKVLSSDMTIPMQMKVAEALKRSYSMKSDPNKRIMLLCRYLGIQFPEYSFNAVIGTSRHGDNYVASDVNMKASFDDNIYMVWGTAKEGDSD
ncbi:hypothetical protein PPYR_12831 [Photinus pyralis]|uniref:Uncharacterized protein n=3 Tax=Photinus pyralis TaxID=7054 RepID=A0A5N4A7A9_PHOPY|nr:uncharacterized protein LOC116179184 [Photinus pyralis]KAB0793211.1 hypothetical protein PPYR_12831 [Photinus pyralis]